MAPEGVSASSRHDDRERREERSSHRHHRSHKHDRDRDRDHHGSSRQEDDDGHERSSHRHRSLSRDREKGERRERRHRHKDGEDRDDHSRHRHRHSHRRHDRDGDDDRRQHRRRSPARSRSTSADREERRRERKNREKEKERRKGLEVVDDDGEAMPRVLDDSAGERTGAEVVGGGEEPDPTTLIPTSASLSLTSHAPSSSVLPGLPGDPAAFTQLKRDDWMLVDSFSSTSTADEPARQGEVRRHADLGREGVRMGPGAQESEPDVEPVEPIGDDDIDNVGRGKMAEGYDSDEVTGPGGGRRTLAGKVDFRHSRPLLPTDAFSSSRGEGGRASQDADGDFFASLGTERQKKPKEERPDPDQLKISSMELNKQLVEGKKLEDYETTTPKTIKPGDPGSSWRMAKLRRVYEQASEEGRPVEDVALERYGSLEAFDEAKNERRWLDDKERERKARRESRKSARGGADTPGGGDRDSSTITQSGRRGLMFSTDSPASSVFASGGRPSRPSSRSSFRRPGQRSPSPSTPSGKGAGGSSKTSTPIPSVFTPTHIDVRRTATVAGVAAGTGVKAQQGRPSDSAERTPPIPPGTTDKTISALAASQSGPSSLSRPPLTDDELNRLQAKVLRAKLAGDDDAERLEEEYEREARRARSGDDEGGGWGTGDGAVKVGGEDKGKGKDVRSEQHGGGTRERVQVLPTLDGRGRLYDVGRGAPGEDETVLPGNKRKREKFETRDPKTGELLRYNADDDDVSLAELVRQERFGGGSADQKNINAEMARRIATDAKFQDDLEYMDENAERLARKKMKTDAMKRQFAIQDYARTKKALDTCSFCWQDEGARPPRAATVASGTRVYLALPQNEELVKGHCLIVPMQHHLSMLEADDDGWDEVKNFMKCLIQMHAEDNKGVVFFETIVSLKPQRHTYIEAVPVPWDLFQDLPAYFRESILSSEEEWSQHKKLIDFASKGFRRSMVPNLPYFMVQFDYKGEKGYGHVIEGIDGADGDGAGDGYDFENTTGTGAEEFPRWFAAEIIGNQLDLEPRRWRKPKRLDRKSDAERVARFRKQYDRFDWTRLLQQQS